MSRKEVLYDYDWACPECGQSGHVSEDDQVYGFCPYCGHVVKIENLAEIQRHHVLMAKRFPPEKCCEEIRNRIKGRLSPEDAGKSAIARARARAVEGS